MKSRRGLWAIISAVLAVIISVMIAAIVQGQSQVVAIPKPATPIATPGLTSTPVNLSGSTIVLDSFQCTNSDATNWAYVQLFQGGNTPNVGVTGNRHSIGLPPAGGSLGPMRPLTFTGGLWAAATTTATGSTTAVTAVNCNFGIMNPQ